MMKPVGKSAAPPVGSPASGLEQPNPAKSVAHKGAWLALGRIVDQGTIGVVGLVLAARVSVQQFAALAIVLIGFSISATLGDLGIGHEMLRLRHDETADQRMLSRVRTLAIFSFISGIVTLLLGSGLLGPGLFDSGFFGSWLAEAELLGWILVLWALNSETALRQSAAMLGDDHRRIGVAQCVGGTCLLAIAVLLDAEVWVLGLALAVRVTVEMVALPSPRKWFSGQPTTAISPIPVVASHATAYGTRNVDFFVAGPILGTVAFGLYVFAFRLANAAFAPIGALTTRLGIAELANDRDDLSRQYERGLRVLLISGIGLATLTMGAAYMLPMIVGDRWQPAVAIIVVLAAALPWRFIDGLIGPLLYVSENHAMAFKVEIARLVVTGAVVLAVAPMGPLALALANSMATIITVWFGHRLAASRASVRTPRGLDGTAAVSAVAALILWVAVR